MPGMGGPGGGAFDFAALQQALNDPAIKQMAEQIANDPSFKEVTKQLQDTMTGVMGGMPPGAVGPGDAAGEGRGAGAPGLPPGVDPAALMHNLDPAKYMDAMSKMFSNPSFMNMAEKLGKTIIEGDPQMANMMQQMQNPSYKNKVEDALKSLKDDPELKPMLAELETAGPMAMMKYWNNPEVLSKLGKAMGDVMELPGVEGGAEGEDGEEGEEEEVDDTVHGAASAGDVEKLKALVEAGANVDEADEEGRTALHLACGYGEMECAKLLIGVKAKLDGVDNNQNTALHYAAGYGQVESVKLLVEAGADKSAKNADGKTALEVAQLNEQADIVKALE